MNRIDWHRDGEGGFSLLEIMIGVGITSIIFLAMASVLGVQFKASAKVSQDLDREAIRRLVLSAGSCPATLPGGTCTAGDPVALLRQHQDGSTSELIAATGQRFDKWVVKTVCNPTGDGLVARAARLKAGAALDSTSASDYLPDPLTEKVYSFADARSLLFPAGIDLCANRSSFVKECIKSDLNPNVGPPGPSARAFTFTSAECNGSPPDATYVCSFASQEVCGKDDTWTLVQPTAGTPPQVGFMWDNGCAPPATPSNIHVVCVKRNGLY